MCLTEHYIRKAVLPGSQHGFAYLCAPCSHRKIHQRIPTMQTGLSLLWYYALSTVMLSLVNKTWGNVTGFFSSASGLPVCLLVFWRKLGFYGESLIIKSRIINSLQLTASRRWSTISSRGTTKHLEFASNEGIFRKKKHITLTIWHYKTTGSKQLTLQ